MAPRKSYSSPLREGKNDPWEFDIEGTAFTAYPGRVPSAILLDVSGVINGDTPKMWEFFRYALTPPPKPNQDDDPFAPQKPDLSEYNRFYAFLRDPDREIQIEQMGELIGDIQEVADSRRPKAQSTT